MSAPDVKAKLCVAKPISASEAWSAMREAGFEPAKALSHRILSPAHLATLAPPPDV